MAKNWRSILVLTLIIFFGGAIFARLFYLQIIKGDYYKALAQGQQNYLIQTKGERGDVFFSQGEVLAMTVQEPMLVISPKEVENKEEIAEKVSQLIGIDKKQIIEKIDAAPNSYYEVVKGPISQEEVEKIENAKLIGVWIDWQPKRYYPKFETAAQIIGFINKDGEAQYGIEKYYNDILEGKEKIKKEKSAPWGFLFSFNNEKENKGSSIYLTIDYNIQFQTEKILKEGIEKYEAEGGEIIVMEPKTGEIIAMAQYPTFDPNNFQKYDVGLFKNFSIQNLFEPGSIFKPITMAAALNENVVTPDTTFVDNSGYVQIGGWKVYNYSQKAWGKRTMTEVLENSINAGVIFAQRALGSQKFYDYIEKFGFFEKTGIDLPFEATPQNLELKKAKEHNIEVTFATASFGQGVEMTPLQIIQAFCAIANNGYLPQPMVAKKIVNSNGEQIIEPKIKRQIIKEDTASTLTNMLVSVVENGYGKLAKVDGYYIAGKTGTSQVPWTSLGINRTGYSDKTWQSFIGFAPAFDPKFVILIKLDNPLKTKTSEYSATPMFHDLAQYILDYWQIPPQE